VSRASHAASIAVSRCVLDMGGLLSGNFFLAL